MLDSPIGNGWEHDKEENLVPVLMNKPAASNAVLDLSLANVLNPLAEKTVVVQNKNFHVQKHVCVWG